MTRGEREVELAVLAGHAEHLVARHARDPTALHDGVTFGVLPLVGGGHVADCVVGRGVLELDHVAALEPEAERNQRVVAVVGVRSACGCGVVRRPGGEMLAEHIEV
jgi:hypothetical protein